MLILPLPKHPETLSRFKMSSISMKRLRFLMQKTLKGSVLTYLELVEMLVLIPLQIAELNLTRKLLLQSI